MDSQTFVLRLRGCTASELESLINSADAQLEVSKPSTRDFGPNDWHSLMVAIRDGSATVLAVARVATWLYDWLASKRGTRSEIQGTLQAKGRSDLRLDGATKEDIEKWFAAG